jgi:hypothetical protein
MAEFWRRTKHPGAAYFYYEMVRRRYPDTEYAKAAYERMLQIREKAEQDQAQRPVPEGGTRPPAGPQPETAPPPRELPPDLGKR